MSTRRESSDERDQYVTFTLGGGGYAIPIAHVQEFKGYTGAKPVPNQPSYLRGVMNLRGVVVPIFDLKARFGMETQVLPLSVVVVVVVGERVAGLLVDEVSDVVGLAPESKQRPPEFADRSSSPFIAGVAQREGRLLVLLDVAKLITMDDAPTPLLQQLS